MVFSKISLLLAAASAEDWEAWKAEYGKVYNGVNEEAYRRSVFDANMVEAAELQKANPEADFGPTKFSDMTKEEFTQSYLNYIPTNASLPEMDLSNLPLEVAASQDWTGRYTTPVKDQGQCGSCWAFSAVEQIESDLIRQHGKSIQLSTQELVDCTGSGGRRNGCQGGDPSAAYRVIEQLGGIETESSYRYTARNGNCRFSRSGVAARVTNYQSVGRGSESSMQNYVGSTGPLSVCVDANSWNSYRGGIMTSCGNSVDHCVQVVGYGTSGSTSYWKVRNSWGGNWGERGHMRLKIGRNLCQINSEPTAVTVSVAAAYEQEWAEFQAVQGPRNGEIPEAFKRNVDLVREHNSKESTFTLSYTGPYADLSEDEFIAQYTGLGDFVQQDDVPVLEDAQEDLSLSDAVDWTTRGAVNPIKNQGQCGSCWAFSTVGTLESAYQISQGTLYSLAEQQLVDCDKSNSGCSGGWPHTAYDRYISRAGYCSESSYSYTARGGSCRASSCDVKLPRGTVTGHTDVGKSSSGLKSALSKQPVSVTVNAGQLQLYSNGVVTGSCRGQINHAVIAVGYGTDGVDYFKIRNSWGTGWGESGYIRLGQNGGSQGTACLFQYSPVTPKLSVTTVV